MNGYGMKKSSFALHEATFSFIVSREKNQKMSIIKGGRKQKRKHKEAGFV
jgi:hypothetical protein